MRSTARWVSALAAVSVLTVAAGAAPKAIRWQTNYKKALATAASRKTIVMIDFYGDT